MTDPIKMRAQEFARNAGCSEQRAAAFADWAARSFADVPHGSHLLACMYAFMAGVEHGRTFEAT